SAVTEIDVVERLRGLRKFDPDLTVDVAVDDVTADDRYRGRTHSRSRFEWDDDGSGERDALACRDDGLRAQALGPSVEAAPRRGIHVAIRRVGDLDGELDRAQRTDGRGRRAEGRDRQRR